ncbi:MAG: homoserine O-acetyltransferase [Bacteroidota bacterium]|nr:homoserine O-acetyltransferase [Bacteroidota bacterium]
MVKSAVIQSLRLESGELLRNVPVSYRTWGSLNPTADNVIVVGHSLTSDSNAADWWRGCIGPGKALDTDRYFVVCANVVGSPYGTLAPSTLNPVTGCPFGSALPQATVRDTVRLHKALLDTWGVCSIAFTIGGSMGGMHALEWTFYGSDYVKGVVPIGVGGRHSAWCVAWSESQRQAIYADSLWQNGDYNPANPPVKGMAAARMIAMVSYRSYASFDRRFGRTHMGSGEFSVESWLRYHGDKIVARFDPACYVYLTHLMDSHDLSRGRGPYEEVLASIDQPALVVGMESDVLYPLEESMELARLMPNTRLHVMEGPHGHDTFLMDLDKLNRAVHHWRRQHIDPLVNPPRRHRGRTRDTKRTRIRSGAAPLIS